MAPQVGHSSNEETMIPVIDLQDVNSLKKIEEAYTTVGFAVFTNALDEPDANKMKMWQTKMQEFFALPLETKKQYPYESDTNLGYSIMGAENVDPTAHQKT